MTTREVIDEDICSECANLCLLEPPKGYYGAPPTVSWHAKALCPAGWPYTRVCLQANAISECPQFEKARAP